MFGNKTDNIIATTNVIINSLNYYGYNVCNRNNDTKKSFVVLRGDDKAIVEIMEDEFGSVLLNVFSVNESLSNDIIVIARRSFYEMKISLICTTNSNVALIKNMFFNINIFLNFVIVAFFAFNYFDSFFEDLFNIDPDFDISWFVQISTSAFFICMAIINIPILFETLKIKYSKKKINELSFGYHIERLAGKEEQES